MNESPEKDQRHRERMERKKAVVDEKIAQARDERGVLSWCIAATARARAARPSAWSRGPWAMA